jgi:hypothetical protein
MDAGSSSNAAYVAYRLHRSAEHVAYRRSLQAVGAAQEASGVREVKSARSSDSFRTTKSWPSPQNVQSARSSPHGPATALKSARSSDSFRSTKSWSSPQEVKSARSSDSFRSTKSSSSSRLPRAPVPAAEAAEEATKLQDLDQLHQKLQKHLYGEILKSTRTGETLHAEMLQEMATRTQRDAMIFWALFVLVLNFLFTVVVLHIVD